MTVFLTADTHFGDHRTINIQRRPFASVADMDAVLVERWNAVVGPDDVVWHLGDRDDPFGDKVQRVGHAGAAYGLRVDPASGKGVVYFTTMVPDGARAAHSGFSPAEEAIARR